MREISRCTGVPASEIMILYTHHSCLCPHVSLPMESAPTTIEVESSPFMDVVTLALTDQVQIVSLLDYVGMISDYILRCCDHIP